jgi:diguanylate cyclase (GGDEF)-like protein
LPLLLFGVFPAIGFLIQVLFYGVLLMWSSMAFSLILFYIYLQQQMIQIDYLTGAWSREKLHIYLNKRISQNKCRNFSIVFIDLDNFKKINDEFGHSEGDRALKDLVKIINKILRDGDSITRYGGDEFILFLNVKCKTDVEAIMIRISDSIKNYNNTLNHSYKLEYSYGYELYDFNSHMTADQYIKYVDELMYKAKNDRKV